MALLSIFALGLALVASFILAGQKLQLRKHEEALCLIFLGMFFLGAWTYTAFYFGTQHGLKSTPVRPSVPVINKNIAP